MDVSKEKLQRTVDECTVFSQCSISFGSWSSTYHRHSSSFATFLNKIAEIDSRPAFTEESLYKGDFPVNTSESSVFLQQGLTWAPFMVKLQISLNACTA